MDGAFGYILPIFITLSSVLSANYGPLFNDTIEDVHVTVGETAILPCSAKHKGDFKIIWMNPTRILYSTEEQIVIDDPRVKVIRPFEDDWNLRIHHVRYNDSGEYTCLINTSPVKIKRVHLIVRVPSHIINSESSGDMDVIEGASVELSCKAIGVPPPNITWFRRSLVSTAGKAKINFYGEKLVLKNIQRYESGMYTCLAFNEVPPATTRQMEIKVQFAPIVKLLNTRLGQLLGKETILECSVTSYPRSKIGWFKNGVLIKHSYKYRLELYPGDFDTVSLTLQILYLNKNDYGDYTCEASNRMGTANATMTLYEYRRPTPPTTTTTRKPPTTTEEGYYYWFQYTDGYDAMADSDILPPEPPHSNRTYAGWGRTDYSYYGNSGGTTRSRDQLYTASAVILVTWIRGMTS